MSIILINYANTPTVLKQVGQLIYFLKHENENETEMNKRMNEMKILINIISSWALIQLYCHFGGCSLWYCWTYCIILKDVCVFIPSLYQWILATTFIQFTSFCMPIYEDLNFFLKMDLQPSKEGNCPGALKEPWVNYLHHFVITFTPLTYTINSILHYSLTTILLTLCHNLVLAPFCIQAETQETWGGVVSLC